jgi:asparagine synthetase B (glutamine-hydrolysing)
MYNSLEARSPFLDRFLYLSHTNRKLERSITRFQSKHELKKIANNIGLNFITKTKKEGFTFPLEKYLLNKNNRDILETLVSNNSIVANYFDIKKIKLLINNDKEISKNFFRLWILLVFNYWHLEEKKS